MPSRRIRQHVNPLRSDLLSIALERLDIPATAPLEVELGSAEAHYLIERAEAEPEGHYVGIEIRDLMVARANKACRALGLTNVCNVFANMRVDLPRLFAPGRVRRFFLNFPDPWFKTRQHKRRVADPELIAELLPLLAPAGEIYVNTDIFAIALDAMAALEAEERLTNLAGPWRFLRESQFAARSRRERQCEAEGARIWRLGYRLRSTADG